MASAGQRYIDTIDGITTGAGGATTDGYADQAIVQDTADGNIYVATAGAWVLVSAQT